MKRARDSGRPLDRACSLKSGDLAGLLASELGPSRLRLRDRDARAASRKRVPRTMAVVDLPKVGANRWGRTTGSPSFPRSSLTFRHQTSRTLPTGSPLRPVGRAFFLLW